MMNRFFRTILTALALVLGLVACQKDDKGISVKDGMNVVGYVKDTKGKPIPGVVVSDGVNCVVTDDQGIYQMKAAKGTRRVFVSVPSDYEIPMGADNLPKIYNNFVLMSGQAVQSDFILTPSAKKTDFTLVAMADIQIENESAYNEVKTTLMPKITEYVKTLSGPVYGYSLGDMVWDQMDYLNRQYKEVITSLNIPVFHVIGNHDFDVKAATNDATADYFRKSFGPVNYSFNIGDCHFIGISDIAYKAGDKAGYGREISAATMEWMKQDLSYVSKDKMIVLSMHVPSQRRYVSSSEVGDDFSYMKSARELYALLDGRPALILSGHLHKGYTVTINGMVEEHNHASVMGEGWSNNALGICNDGCPRSFYIYKFSGPKLVDQYQKGILFDRNFQMRVYKPGECDKMIDALKIKTASKGDMIINVFNWHYTWTVSVDEDGTSTNLSNIKIQDLTAYGVNYSHASCDHMFKYTPKSSNWKKITVTAKDPYGNVYTESVTR